MLDLLSSKHKSMEALGLTELMSTADLSNSDLSPCSKTYVYCSPAYMFLHTSTCLCLFMSPANMSTSDMSTTWLTRLLPTFLPVLIILTWLNHTLYWTWWWMLSRCSVFPWSQKGHGKYLWKRTPSHEKGIFTCALQSRGHSGNGALLQQEYTDAGFTLLFSFLQPYFSLLPSFSFLQPPTWIGTASNKYLQSTLQAYLYFYMIAQ